MTEYYEDEVQSPKGVSLLIVGLIVAVIVVGSVLIPLVFSLLSHPTADIELDPGDTWVYTPTTNIPCEITLSGNATAYIRMEGQTIVFSPPDGYYELTITATSEYPYQTATQTIRFWIGESTPEVDALLIAIPIFVLIGIMVTVIRKMGISSGGDSYDYDHY